MRLLSSYASASEARGCMAEALERTARPVRTREYGGERVGLGKQNGVFIRTPNIGPALPLRRQLQCR